jgi:hypothetical protein
MSTSGLLSGFACPLFFRQPPLHNCRIVEATFVRFGYPLMGLGASASFAVASLRARQSSYSRA